MGLPFVFVHGWGMGSAFWDDLIDQMPGIDAYRVDLGFIGGAMDFVESAPEPAVYVTHSLGTMWAIKNREAQMKALIAVNGFARFTDYTQERTLRAMQARLQREPKAQMNEFWDMCGLTASDDLNIKRLGDGLEWLSSWDVSAARDALSCPVMALAGGKDPILPRSQIEKEWASYDVQLCEDGGHALPLTHPKWCAAHIREVVDAL